MRILLTSFQPFGGATTNLSQLVMEAMPSQIGEVCISKQVLPVSYESAVSVLLQAIQFHQPDLILLTGQCRHGEQMRLERFAHNMMDSRDGDTDGFCPKEQLIYPNESLALQTTVGCSLRDMCDHLLVQNLPVKVSNTPGLFICNRVYYEVLHRGYRALFVHVPKGFSLEIANQTLCTIISQLS